MTPGQRTGTTIIFITQEDIFEKDLAKYTFTEQCEEIKDPRILKIDKIVNEVKESEEWEAVHMNIFEIGVNYGEERGEARGEKRLNLLNKKLLDDNRLDDLRRSIEDETYRKKLYKEYNI